MKKITCAIIMFVICFFAANSGITQNILSVGPAPVSDTKYEQGVNNTLLGANSRGFVYISGTNSHQFGKQFMGNVTVTNIGSLFTTPGWIGALARNTTTGVIYVNNQASPFQIWSVDTTTGATTLVVSSCTGLPQTNFTGMVWDHTTNTMYGVSTSLSASQIFTINLTTGVCTPVGSPSTTITGAIGLYCAPNGTLFSNCIVTDNLYKWNKTTGAATLVGPLGYAANYGQDGSFDFSDGMLYLASAGPGNILRVCDTTTGGATTVIGTYTGQPACLTVCGNISTPTTGIWEYKSNGLPPNVQVICFILNGTNLFAGTYGNGVYLSTNYGENWISYSNGLPSNIYDFAVIDNNLFAAAEPGYVYKSTNNGTNWTQLINGLTDPQTLQLDVKGTDLYAGTYTNGIFRTTNNGNNWSNCLNTYRVYSLYVKDNSIFAGTHYSGVFRSTNNGLNWVGINNGINFAVMCGFTSIGNNLFAGTRLGGVFLSTNNGDNWNSVNNGLIYNGDVHVGSKNSTLFAGLSGTGGGMFISTNKGGNWEAMNQGFDTIPGIYMLSVINNYLFASTSRGVWRRDISEFTMMLNLKVYLEGFWNGTSQVTDTVKVYLANSTSPYALADSSTAVLSSSGTSNLMFSRAFSGSYYIVIKHRNHLETWSALPQSITAGTPLSYDFTTAQSQAYGNNLIYSNGAWCIYGGDINKDGFIDGADMAPLDNDLYNYVSGYVITDLNGDQFVDGADMAILDNNLYNYIGVIRPGGKDANQRSINLKPERKQNKTIWDIKEKPNKVIKK